MTDRDDYHGLLYRDDSGDFRWRLLARNGNIVSDSSEGYQRAIDCEEMFKNLHPDVRLEFEDSSDPQT